MVLIFSLVGGLLIAVVLQLVFADLGVALGLSLLNLSPQRSAEKHLANSSGQSVTESGTDDLAGDTSKDTPENTPENTKTSASDSDFSLPVTHLLGFGVAFGLSAIIFVGALLSVEFSGLLEPRRGIIFGLIFWSTYWLLFIWLCSTTITGIADSLVGGAIASGRRLISTVKQSFSETNEPSDDSIGSDSFFSSVVQQQTVIRELAEEVSKLANRQEAIPDLLENQRDILLLEIDTAISQRLNAELSEEENEEPAQKAESKHSRTEVAIAETDQSAPPAVTISSASTGPLSELPSWQQIARNVINQVDLSDWDIETLLQQIPVDTPKPSTIASQIRGSATTLLPERYSKDPDSFSGSHENLFSKSSTDRSATLQAIQTKLENYCRYTSLSALTTEKLSEKVRSQLQAHNLLEKDASGSEIISTVDTLDIESIETILSRRQNLSAAHRGQLIEALELAWPPVSLAPEQALEKTLEKTLEQASEPHPTVEERASNVEDTKNNSKLSAYSITKEASQTAYQSVYQTIDSYFQSIDWDALSLEDIKPEVNSLLSQLEEGSLATIDWPALASRIQIHHDIRHDIKEDLMNWLEATLTSKLQSARPLVIHTAKDLSEYFTEQITNYLKHREKPDLHPVKAVKELSQIVGDAIATLSHSQKLADLADVDISFDQVLWDKSKWQQVLESRQDMSAAEIQQLLTWGEQTWEPKAKQIASWLEAVRSEVSEYLSLPDKTLLAQASEQVSEQIGEQVTTVQETISDVQEAVSEQIVAAKAEVQTQVTAVKEEIQTQVDSGRRQIAIAAWWLFIALVSSGSAAASAGWLATIY